MAAVAAAREENEGHVRGRWCRPGRGGPERRRWCDEFQFFQKEG